MNIEKHAYNLLVGFSMLDNDYGSDSYMVGEIVEYSKLDREERREFTDQIGWRNYEL